MFLMSCVISDCKRVMADTAVEPGQQGGSLVGDDRVLNVAPGKPSDRLE